MPSIIQTDTIKDASASNILVEQSGSDWKWGSKVPAGTCLQVTYNSTSEENPLTTGYVNYWENSITLKSASSDIYGIFNFQYKVVASAGFGVKVYRNNSATVTTSHTAVWTKNLAGSLGEPYTYYNDHHGTGTINLKDSLSGFSVGDTLYYGLFARKYTADDVRFPADDTEDGFFSLILMEVQK